MTGTAFDGPEWGMEPYSNMFSANPPASTPFNGVRYTWDSTGKFFKQVGRDQAGRLRLWDLALGDERH